MTRFSCRSFLRVSQPSDKLGGGFFLLEGELKENPGLLIQKIFCEKKATKPQGFEENLPIGF